MEPARRIREKLARAEMVTGMLVTEHLWPALVEVAAGAGLDYLVVDLEHGPHSEQLVAEVCALARVLRFAVLIRPTANDFRTLGKTLDLGPCGLLLAAIEGPEDLDVVRDAARLPPWGRRRPGGAGNRWVPDYHRKTWAGEVEADLIVVPQIETRRGLDLVDAIAAHEMTTALGIGPYDLGMALGCGLDWAHPTFVDAVAKLNQAARDAGKRMWRIGDAASLAREGCTFPCVGELTGLLDAALRRHVKSAKA